MEKNFSGSVVLRLLPFFKRHIGKLAISLVMMLIVTCVHLARPMILRSIIDEAIPKKSVELAVKYASIFVACLFVGAIALYIRVKLMARLSAMVVAEIKTKLFTHILSQGMDFFDNNQSGKLITRTESDANQLRTLFAQSTSELFSNLLLIVCTFGVIFYENTQIGAVAVVAMVITIVVMFFYLRFIRRLYTGVREKNSRLTGYLTEFIQGIQLIKAYNREEEIKKTMHAYNKEKAELDIRAEFYEYAVFSSIFFWITNILSLAALIWYCTSMVFAGKMTVGTMVMFIELIRQFFRPLAMLMEVLSQLQTALACGVRLFGILDEAPSVKDAKENTQEIELKNKLKFENVSFSYGKETVLNDVSFEIPKGRQLAIVGASGSGKTTCISLLLRFYNLDIGKITIDGHDISDIAIETWRKNISLVLQEIYLFPGTIMQNLKAFNPDISDEAVYKAAKELGAHDFIINQPQGYNTILAERGANLSYGERQLLSYTRAMVKDPEILILDEATSSVDVITEKQLQHSMEKLMKGRTSIVIAHRLSTIRKADNILVFNKGKIVQQGKHHELMAIDGIYKNLIRLQNGENIRINSDGLILAPAEAEMV